MTQASILAAALLMAGNANAGIPLINVTCPSNLEVHADEGGPVFINGKETKLKMQGVMFTGKDGDQVP